MLDSAKYKLLVDEYIDISVQTSHVVQTQRYEQAAQLRDTQRKILDDIKKLVMSNQEDRGVFLSFSDFVKSAGGKFTHIPNKMFENFIIIWFDLQTISRNGSHIMDPQEVEEVNYIRAVKRDYKIEQIIK